jgi:nucleotide-binding universal stress UspA family protein
MLSIKKILVPTDFSDGSALAVGYALSLAKDHGAEVIAVHAISSKAIKPFSEPYLAGGVGSAGEAPIAIARQPNLENLFESRKQVLHNFLEQRIAPELLRAVKITPLIRLGKVVDEIVSAAKEVQSDVIVMTSQASRLRRLFVGSFTERVIRRAPCPVLPSAEVRTDKDERVPVRLIDRWAA